MHLLYVLPEFPPDFGGGIATVYGRLLPRLAAQGHRITVLLASRERLDQPGYCWQGVEVVPLQSPQLAQAQEELKAWRHHAFLNHFLPLAWAAWHQAQDLAAFDVVEVTDWALLFLPWLVQQRRQPVMVSLHGSCGQVDWHGNPGARGGEGQLVRLLETAVLPLADGVIANSSLNADFWWQQCGMRAQVIPPLAEDLNESASLPAPPGGNLMAPRSDRGVVVGRLQNWKGPEVLCRALRLLPGQQVDWIGQDTTWEEGCMSTADYLRRGFPDVVDHQLHLLGQLPPHQVRDHISQASFLCVPSFFDVFNITILEAIAVRTPVICSRQAGGSMLLQQEGAGYLFDPDKPEQLAEAMKSLKALTAAQKFDLCESAMAQAISSCEASRVARQATDAYVLSIQNWHPRGGDLWIESVIINGIEVAIPKASMRCRKWIVRLVSILKKRTLMAVNKFQHPRDKTASR